MACEKTDRRSSGRLLVAIARNDDSSDMDTQTHMPRTEQAWPRLVTPTPEEIRYAEELRRRIEARYLAPNGAADDEHSAS
jgi:hypothetical protein